MNKYEDGSMKSRVSENRQLTSTHRDQLIHLANDRSKKGRALLTTAVVELFSGKSRLFTGSDYEVMTDIIIKLIDGIEKTVKAALAERLADEPNVPRELALHFANMESSIAFPILKNSTALRDPDLINIVMNKTREHHMAVSMRAIVPASVSRALVDRGDDGVVKSLLENKGAEIDDKTFEDIAKRTNQDSIFSAAIVRRHDLPKSVAKQLYWAISAALRQDLIFNHGIDEDSIDNAIEDVIPQMIEGIEEEKSAGEEFANQVERAVRQGELGDTLLALLNATQIPRFTTWFATACHLREGLANRIMFEEGGECFAAICKAVGIDSQSFLAIFILLRQGRLGDKRVPSDEIKNVSAYFEKISTKEASALLKRLQRNPELLNAIRVLDAEED